MILRNRRRTLDTRSVAAVVFGAALVFAACAAGASPGPSGTPDPGGTPGPSATPTPTALAAVELKYVLLDRFGPLSFCDPDMYPVGVNDIAARAAERFPEVEADTATFVAILARLGIPQGPAYAPDQVLAIYTEWKMLNAIVLEPIGNDRFRFDITTMAEGAAEGLRTAGIVDALGTITVEQQANSGPLNCPICLARGTLISTPDGPRAVQDLPVGDPVWSVDESGIRVAATILQVGSVTAPATHHVVHVVLDDGRELFISPGHPLLDGRTAGDLRTGDALDGGRVTTADLVAYGGGQTFDLLPSGPTGGYWAGGILVGSTLAAPGN
ncbi:MAG: Hint domain-containing protein [Chloroflexota bacterium]